jgi:outer membrane autotransporter protein
MIRRVQLRREAQRRVLFALERSPSAIVNGGVSRICLRDNLRGCAQWQSRALHTVLLAASLAPAAANGANAQFLPPTVGPSPPIQTDTVVSPPFTEIVGNTTTNVPVGDGIDAPPDAAPGGTLAIKTESGPSPGPISITSGGTGVASIFPSSPAIISISSGPHGDVTIMSGGAALGVSGDVSLTASNADGGTLTFQSTGAFGVVAQFGAKVDITGATDIANSGVGAVLIGGDLTDQGAIGNLTNVDISTTDAVGLDATRMGTIATMTNGSITVTGAGLAALYSDTDGLTNVFNVKITTMGDNTYGAFAEATIPDPDTGILPGGGTIHITGGSITTNGMDAFGVFAEGQPSVPSTITLTNSMLTTTNVGAVGYRADGTATVSATNTTALTTGAAAPGGMLSNGATIMISGGSVKTTGAGSFGFLVQPFTPTASLIAEPGLPALPLAAEPTSPNMLQISNNATVTSAADAFHVQGAIADIAVSGSSITSGNGVLLNTVSSGATTLTAAGSQLTGAITTDATSTANVTLENSTTWTMTGNSNVTNLTNDPSLIQFTPPTGDPTLLASYKTLTVVNYIGQGGTIGLNTYLGDDSSPSDRLIISGGSATGSTTLTIHNTAGPGAQTTANGILVVNAVGGATTAPGAFTLANGELRGGAFDYDLFRGGVSGSPNNWFLRSDFIAPPIPPEPPIPPIPPIPPQPPILPPDPPPNPLPPGAAFPIIGPELATYGVVQPLARELGLSILGTLDDRVGDTYEPDGCAVAPTPPAADTPAVDLPTKKPAAVPTKKPGPAPCPLFSPSVWGRFFGQTVHNQYSAFADPSANGNLGGFQGGIDLLRGSLIAGHYERAGLYGAYGDVNADVDGLVTNPAATAYVLTHTGSMSLNAWSAGGYWTHVGPGGWYLDAVLQGTWYYGSASTQFARLNTDGTGFIASLEGGYPYAWPQLGPGFVLEPQGQILWQKVSFRHDYDGLGDVALGDTTGPSGRIGLRTKWTISTAGGQVWQPYLRANLWRDWGADANTVYSGTDIVQQANQATMLELGGGLTGRINANISVFANVDYEFAVGASESEKRNGVRGAFGARYTW